MRRGHWPKTLPLQTRKSVWSHQSKLTPEMYYWMSMCHKGLRLIRLLNTFQIIVIRVKHHFPSWKPIRKTVYGIHNLPKLEVGTKKDNLMPCFREYSQVSCIFYPVLLALTSGSVAALLHCTDIVFGAKDFCFGFSFNSKKVCF